MLRRLEGARSLRAGRAEVRLLPDPGHGAACRRARDTPRALDAVGPEWGRVWAQPPVASRRSPRRPWRRRSRPHHRRRRGASSSSRSRSTSPLAGAGRGSFRSSASSAWGGLHASPGPRSPIGSVRTARKLGGSLGEGDLRCAAPSAGRAGGDAGVSGTGCERAHARAGTRGADRRSARPPGAGRPGSQAARHLGSSGRLLAELAHAARADGGARPPSARASTQAVGAAGSDGGAPPRAGRAHRVGRNADRARPTPRSRLRERLRGGMRQVRAAVGMDAVCTVVEVAPWSRIPESRAILVPRDD